MSLFPLTEMALSWSMFTNTQRLLGADTQFLPAISINVLHTAVQLEVIAANTCARWEAKTITSNQFRLISGYIIHSMHSLSSPQLSLDDTLIEIGRGNPAFYNPSVLSVLYPDLNLKSANAVNDRTTDSMAHRRESDGKSHQDADEKNDKSCLICMNAPISTVLFPCRHSITCKSCLDKWNQACPYCRTPVERTEWFFPTWLE